MANQAIKPKIVGGNHMDFKLKIELNKSIEAGK